MPNNEKLKYPINCTKSTKIPIKTLVIRTFLISLQNWKTKIQRISLAIPKCLHSEIKCSTVSLPLSAIVLILNSIQPKNIKRRSPIRFYWFISILVAFSYIFLYRNCGVGIVKVNNSHQSLVQSYSRDVLREQFHIATASLISICNT